MCKVDNGVRHELREDGRSKRRAYFKTEIVWRNVIAFIILHSIAAATLIFGVWRWTDVFFTLGLGYTFGLSITVGAHRLWAHKCYKAKLPFRIVLMLLNCGAAQNDIYIWARDHRLHHKFVETDADPHTTTRGMFFAHMGWLMMKKHKNVTEKGKTIDCSDLLGDPVVAFQRKYFYPLTLLIGFILPVWFHCSVLGASLHFAVGATLLRYMTQLHGTWCINSLAHWFGDRPYDPSLKPANNPVMKWFFLGESFHNYHHVFPFDYKSTEYPFNVFDLSALIIRAMAAVGQAYDLKEASQEIVAKRKAKVGQGGHIY